MTARDTPDFRFLDAPPGEQIPNTRGHWLLGSPTVLFVAFHRDSKTIWKVLTGNEALRPQGSLWRVVEYSQVPDTYPLEYQLAPCASAPAGGSCGDPLCDRCGPAMNSATYRVARLGEDEGHAA